MRVRAKRSGWDEVLTVEQSFDLDPYDYEDDDLEGELVVIDAGGPGRVGPAYKQYLVGGQCADPKTIRPLTDAGSK
jgi:hypothetical protein